jgi:hypothetical protein
MSLDIPDDIVSGEITLRFLQECHHFVGIHSKLIVVVHIDLSVEEYFKQNYSKFRR